MDDALFAGAVTVLAIGGILGIAYSLDARRKRRGTFGPKLPPPGRVGRALWLLARVLVALMLVAVAGAHLFRVPALAWLAGGCLVLFFADHVAYRLVRLTGK